MKNSEIKLLEVPKMKLIDQYNRHINYLRISITEQCNLRCIYCMSQKRMKKLSHKNILRYEEIIRLVRIFGHLGITKIRITGGEPLVRKGIYGFLEKLNTIDGIEDISLTTNGVLLKDNIDKIRDAGIKRINISMDTLNRKKFKQITGHDFFDKVWEGIHVAQDIGFAPIKLNVVVLNGINDDEFIDFARLTFSQPFHIRFIEYMPIGDTDLNIKHHLLTPEIKRRISKLGKLIPIAKEAGSGPASQYKFEDAMGEIGFISALSHPFCSSCNRLRLTASGLLRPCLLSDEYQSDLKEPLRSGCLDTDIADIITNVVKHKPLRHHVENSQSKVVSGQMSSIGG